VRVVGLVWCDCLFVGLWARGVVSLTGVDVVCERGGCLSCVRCGLEQQPIVP
jgi:hypothetical protein